MTTPISGQPWTGPGIDDTTTAVAAHNTAISNSLVEVSTAPTTGQTLQWDGSKWVPVSNLPVVVSYETSPPDHGFNIWTNNPEWTTNSASISAGHIHVSRMWVPQSISLTQMGICTRGGGTGAQALVNCYLAIFNKNGIRLGVTATQASVWGATPYGPKMATLTPDFTGALDITGGLNEYVFGAVVIGTQSSTALTVAVDAQQTGVVPNMGLLNSSDQNTFKTGAIPNAFTTSASTLTSMPTSIDMSSIIADLHVWFAAT